MSVLAINEIKKRLNKDDENNIIVTPILDKKNQIQQTGIDYRLSNQFIISETQNIESYDIRKFIDNPQYSRKYRKEAIIPFGKSFILHPQTMVLGGTFEFISLPNDIGASIEGISSWARTGLMIATAVYVYPGFNGCITLELSNLSNILLKLFPGVKIAHIIFNEISSLSIYKGKKYQCPIGPEISKIKSDDDYLFFFEFSITSLAAVFFLF
jgi:deoxycytidine triphosphate deaminase